ncbi:hypothetical protein E8E11_003979 [Didymella keratinophila]|nr:hypothetical protein E8E11_003979 [Didymella keratinophila]
MNAFATTQAEDRTITKPPEWAVYMVTAALKCASDEKLPATYTSQHEAQFQILRSLNWSEAHNVYERPDFSSFNYDFSQVMRLRRALVQDIFNALEKAGNLHISIPGTPDSHVGRRSAPGRTIRTNNRKRLCKREAEIDEDAISETSDGGHGAFLLEVMTDLVNRSKLELGGSMHDEGDRDPHEFANVVHDKLVEVWTKPQRETDDLSDVLRQKAELWERHRRSHPPRSSQMERTSTPRRPPGNQQISPDTVQKPVEGSASAPRAAWDRPGGWTSADQQEQDWANTNSIS